MKPDWKDAPEWANYLVMDEDGDWYWFESKPYISYDRWMANDGNFKLADITGISWKQSLDKKPKK